MNTDKIPSSKFQAPEKHQVPKDCDCCLAFGASLEFGCWILELLPSHPRNSRPPPQCCRATYLTIQPFNKSRFVIRHSSFGFSIRVHLCPSVVEYSRSAADQRLRG